MRMRTLLLFLPVYTVPQAPLNTPARTTTTVRLTWIVCYCSDPRPLSLFPLRSFPTRPTNAAGLFRPVCPAKKQAARSKRGLSWPLRKRLRGLRSFGRGSPQCRRGVWVAVGTGGVRLPLWSLRDGSPDGVAALPSRDSVWSCGGLKKCGRVAVFVSRPASLCGNRCGALCAVFGAARKTKEHIFHERVRGVTVHAPALILCFWPCCRTSAARRFFLSLTLVKNRRIGT
ncbi:MAG: Unknown protein [uncultured Thiotrichaceae bacterium]|uniref:Uncharacterized protein n=1 Tax=uncultured Thiotrichaceae bacterium TaxID=298394 RepID=A0A6S6TJJ0_9GAMM|nr:MAG: Unknown protein [uncultured Thiotrichaceae bacterium]